MSRTAGGQLSGPVLILGTDASGKDHVARLAQEHLGGTGRPFEKRRGLLSAAACDAESSERKSAARLFAERLFLRIYPFLGPILAPGISLCILADVLAFRLFRRAPALVVSHSPIRLLAFHMGHAHSFRAPGHLRHALAHMRKCGLTTLLVTADPSARIRRIECRIRRDTVDNFDLYMAKSPELGENIAQSLRRVALDHLAAIEIPNDEDGDERIRETLRQLWP